MPLLDFKEIPEANRADGQQDTFELFAREFLEFVGYRIKSGPDRGIDGGRDLILEETRSGVGGESSIRWLVSCKHYAHSGRSVGVADEIDIVDRVHANQCTGFIGFYSTLAASGLSRKLEGIKIDNAGFEFQILDHEKVERDLLQSGVGQGIAQRFFANSYTRWVENNFDVDLAMARVGMPQPILFKVPDGREITWQQAIKEFPQGNKFLFNPWQPQEFIYANNLLGLTKLNTKDGLVDLPDDYNEKTIASINWNIENMRKHHTQDQPKAPTRRKPRSNKKR